MNTLISALTFLQAGAADPQGNSMIFTGLTFGAVILIFYFLIIRPQNKKQKDLEKMLSNIKKGDKVVTIGGMRGVVQSTTDETVVLKVDEGSSTTLEFNKNAIAGLVNPPVAKKEEKEKKEPKKLAKAAEIQPEEKK